MRSFSLALLAVTAAFLAPHVSGQAVITPSAPSSNDVITARSEVLSTGCNITVETTVLGSVIRAEIRVTGCIVGPPPFPVPIFATFGPLPAGTFTYEVFERRGNNAPTLLSTQTIVVSAVVPPLPTADEWALIALTGALAFAGLVASRSRAG